MSIRDELEELAHTEPFEPFRLKLVNGDHFDVADPGAMAVQARSVWIGFRDGHWVVFGLDKITSLESLVADFRGENQPREE